MSLLRSTFLAYSQQQFGLKFVSFGQKAIWTLAISLSRWLLSAYKDVNLKSHEIILIIDVNKFLLFASCWGDKAFLGAHPNLKGTCWSFTLLDVFKQHLKTYFYETGQLFLFIDIELSLRGLTVTYRVSDESLYPLPKISYPDLSNDYHFNIGLVSQFSWNPYYMYLHLRLFLFFMSPISFFNYVTLGKIILISWYLYQ